MVACTICCHPKRGSAWTKRCSACFL